MLSQFLLFATKKLEQNSMSSGKRISKLVETPWPGCIRWCPEGRGASDHVGRRGTPGVVGCVIQSVRKPALPIKPPRVRQKELGWRSSVASRVFEYDLDPGLRSGVRSFLGRPLGRFLGGGLFDLSLHLGFRSLDLDLGSACLFDQVQRVHANRVAAVRGHAGNCH